MSYASVFEFRYPADAAEEGFEVARGIGADMLPTAGYQSHQVIRDLSDSGHVVVITHWSEQSEAEAVLHEYQHDPKVAKATELGGAPAGFLGHDVNDA